MSKYYTFLLTYIFLQQVVLSERIHQAQTTTRTNKLKTELLSISTNEELNYYFNNPYIYGIDVFYVEYGRFIKVEPLKVVKNGNDVDLSILQSRSDCFPMSRYMHIEEVLNIQLYNKTVMYYYTDIMVKMQQNVVLLLEENYRVHPVHIDYEYGRLKTALLSSSEVVDLRNYIQTNINSTITADNPKLFTLNDQSNIVVLITKYGAVCLELANQTVTPTKFIPLIQRENIYEVHIHQNQIYVAAGDKGVDLYEIKVEGIEININYIMTLNKKSLNLTVEINAIDIESEGSMYSLTIYNKQDYLIVVDQNSGLYYLERSTQQLNKTTLLFHIPFPRIKAFSHYNESYIIIAETINRIEYVAELFVNIPKQEYFFNRVYIENTAFNHIQMTPVYAILIGEEEHIVIQHGIFNDFVRKQNEIVTSFEEDELVKFTLLSKETTESIHEGYGVDYYAGLAKGDFKIFEVFHKNPSIICSFLKPTAQSYKLEMNSTRCTQNENYEGVYQQCKITQFIDIKVDSPLFESDALLQIVLSVVGFLVALIVLGFLVFICRKRWQNEVNALKTQVESARKYQPLELDASSILVKDHTDNK